MHTSRTESFYLTQLIAVLIACTLFAVGRFGFFDILGMKRNAEIVLFTPLAFFGILLLISNQKKWLNIFMLFPLSYFLVQISWDLNLLNLADLSATILIISIILTMGAQFSDLLLRYIIKISAFFAILGIIEFIILLFEPSLSKKILLFYDEYSGSNVMVINHYLQLLGLADGTSYHLWGKAVTRLRSFASEPSLLVGYFLIPGALALTYRGKYIFYGACGIFFSILSLSGSVFVTLCFALAAFTLSQLKSRVLITAFPFIVLVLFVWILNTHYSELIALTKSGTGGYDFLDKSNSANVRFSYIYNSMPIILHSPFGVHEEIHQALGLLVAGMARGGIPGFIFTLIILGKFYYLLAKLLINKYERIKKIAFSIIYGALTTGILYLDNCFIQVFGFTMLLLTYNRLFLINSFYRRS